MSSTTRSNTVSGNTSKINTRYLTTTAIMAAMITVMTAYVAHIPVGSNGGYIHFGDGLIYVAAAFLPTPYAMVAAALGGGLADVLTGAYMWAPATIIIKALITLPFTSKKEKFITPRNVIATMIAYLISSTGYYIAELIIMAGTSNVAVSFVLYLQSIGQSAIQSGGSAILFLVLGIAFDRIGIKKKFLK